MKLICSKKVVTVSKIECKDYTRLRCERYVCVHRKPHTPTESCKNKCDKGAQPCYPVGDYITTQNAITLAIERILHE